MSSPRSGPDHGSEQLAAVILIVAALGLLTSGGAWLTGQLTLLATGHDWTPAPITHSPTLVTALLHGHNPPRAWRTAYPAAAVLPSAAGYWAIAAVLCVNAVVVVTWV